MLPKVLLKKNNKKQSVGASIGIFTGLFLLLFALQVYLDVQVLSKGARDSNFLVINKNFEKYMGKSKDFTAQEIAEIKAQPFFNSVDVFTSNKFQVMLASEQMNFQTLLFFQSVPNQYLEIDTTEFAWKPGGKIPIILSRDYLALYNYGLAPSQGMPQFSASTIGMVDFDIYIKGRGKQDNLKGSVIGFTNNVNSILVPKSFMDYYNQNFGGEKGAINTTQVMTSTDNPYSLPLESFLDKNGYEISRGGLIGGELKSTLYLLVLLIIVIGIIIIGLAMLVFILNFQVLVAKASHDIQLLLQLGYKDKQISAVLGNNLIKLFLFIWLSVILLLFIVKYFVSQSIIELGYENISPYLHYGVLLVGILFAGIFVAVNLQSIRKNVRNLA